MKKKILKVLAAFAAVVLIGMVLFVAGSYVGDPISAMRANRDIRKYVQQNYSDLDLKVDKANYNFKFGNYIAHASSKTSKDTTFSIYWDGEVTNDDYQSYVVEKFNTYIRMEGEARDEISPLLQKISGVDRVWIIFEKEEFDEISDKIKLDMPFQKSLQIPMSVDIDIVREDSSFESIARVLKTAHRILKQNGYSAVYYTVSCDNGEETVCVRDVSTKQIEGENLVGLIRQASEKEDTLDKDESKEYKKEISVYTKYNNDSK